MFLKIDVPSDVVKIIKQKAIKGELTIDDIKKTSFSAVFDGSIDEDAFEYCIDDFSDLPDEFNGAVFVGEDFDGFKFFSTEEDLIHAFEKDASDSCGEYWNNRNPKIIPRRTK